ncbi:hypothetical protein [Neobacillus sp. CF12]|uniref:hypothetical protein n=1 Tax=Neobacillus sp. CF12 TaxID=3055864 RepID=UPI0025A17C4E|nr:hypothetical protein [Neobacillus sp. CF12]MDM5329935.1 hypothetical protein [Neobacillus sp. CF12]
MLLIKRLIEKNYIDICHYRILTFTIYDIYDLIQFLTGGEHVMILPNGVTGFYDSEANKPPTVDGKQFKQLCFDFAARNGGKVIEFSTPQYPANFYHAHVKVLGNVFYILLNAHYPYLTFASLVEPGNIAFIDQPTLNEPFSPFYRVLGTVELNVPFNQTLAKNTKLNRTELEQLAYWKPETVGQIIFNFWD